MAGSGVPADGPSGHSPEATGDVALTNVFGNIRPVQASGVAAAKLGAKGPLANAIASYEDRPSQLAMAEAVEDALAHDGIALIEAPTGTGKTLAYLVPALLSGKKVVISTGTKTLQDQIMEHDLPLLRAHLGEPVEAACMKGLSNYLCLRRYEEFVRSAEADQPVYARHLPILREFVDGGAVLGERAELLGLPEDAPVWSQINSGSDTRIGSRCSYYDECFVTRMRRQAEQAQLIVVNHHLFFADLATRGPHGGGALPEYDAVIFDEAHQIEDIVTEFFGVRVSTSRLEILVRDALRAAAAARIQEEFQPLGDALLTAGSAFFAQLPRARQGEPSGRKQLPDGRLYGEAEQALFRLDAALEALALHAKLRAGSSEGVAQTARRVQQVRDDLSRIAQGDSHSHVVWTESRGRSLSIGASPVDASGILREQLYERAGAVVMTSATLTTGGNFNFVKERLGIDFEVDELCLESPFDYAAQAALYLPPDLPDPRDPAYVEAAAKQILSLVEMTGGGAFVLCTSLAMMKRLYERCRAELDAPPLVQGSAPKAALLDTFRRRSDAVLFASASFWEGVDVPGDALRLVVIDKLPFEVPSDPLVQARCVRLEERGHKPFMRYLVPNAALALKQGFGRLVRSQRDRGVVAVLDKRLTSKGYGRVFLKSLPPASRCYSLDEVRAFWELAPDALEKC